MIGDYDKINLKKLPATFVRLLRETFSKVYKIHGVGRTDWKLEFLKCNTGYDPSTLIAVKFSD